MALLKVEADKLTNPSLQRGVIEVLIDRGAREVMGNIVFKSFEGQHYAFNREASLPTGSSARDPYGDSIPTGVGTRSRLTVDAAMLIRNADTAKIDVIGKSDINEQRKNDVMLSAKKLAQDYVSQFISGMHDTTGTRIDYNMQGLEWWLDNDGGTFTEQRMYGTSDGTTAGTASQLSLNMLDDLLSRYKGSRHEIIYSNRATQVAYVNLLNLAGGNTSDMFMVDNFGAPYFGFRGLRWYILDQAGEAKTSGSASGITSGAATLVIDDTLDPYWIGFSSLDVGRAIDVAGAGAAAATLSTTIASVTNERTVVLAANAGTTTTNTVTTMAAVNVIYACRFDEVDGISAIYHRNRGVPANAGEHYGPIAGFDVEDLGLLEASPKYRTRLDWYGNFVVHSPFAVARLSHFAI